MQRYAVRRAQRGSCDDLEIYDAEPKTIEVVDVREDVEPTGLVDQYGNQICRVKDRIGFVR